MKPIKKICMALAGIVSLMLPFQACAPGGDATVEATPTIAAVEETPAPETSTTGPLREEAAVSAKPWAAGALSSPNPTLSPLTGSFAVVNNNLESNGAAEAVGMVISSEDIQIALVSYYMDTVPDLGKRDDYERVLNIYEALPYKGGALVLAERQQEGESGPSLHYILNGKVERVSGQGVWWINYTWLEGEYIFYGLTSMEPLPGDAAFIYQDHSGALRRFSLRDGRWFIAAVGQEFPADLYFVDSLGQRVSDTQTEVFYNPEQEVLANRLLYQPMLPKGVTGDYLPMQEGKNIENQVPMPMFAWKDGDDAGEKVPPAVVWRDANLIFNNFSGEDNLRFVDMDGVKAIYLAVLAGEDGRGDGADRLQTLNLADIRKDDGTLPLPEEAGAYAYIVDKTIEGGVARYGLPFQVAASQP